MSLRIYITGSGGVLGRHVCSTLTERLPRCVLVGNSADLTNLTETRDALCAAGPLDLVIHLAALVPVEEVIADPARGYAVNAAGTINLLAALAEAEKETGHRARLLFCSTGHVYRAQNRPIREDDPTDPISLYGKTKLLGEQAARAICFETGRSLCVTRLFSMHDPAQQGSYLRPTLERRLRDWDPSTPFDLYGAGSQRDFLTAKAAANQLVRLALSQAEGIVNLGSGQPQTVAEFAQSLSDVPLNIKPKGTDNNLVPDVTRLHEILGDLND